MRDIMLLLAVVLTAYLGFALFALSQPRNWSIAMRNRPFRKAPIPALRLGGGVLLAGSLAIALVRDGPAFGAILWVVTLAMAGLTVVATLTLRSKASGN